VPSALSGEAELIGLAGRRVPIVAVCDGEAGLLDNLGSIVGVKQLALAVRKFSKCGRPDQVFGLHHLDAESIAQACGRALAETALENVRVSAQAFSRWSAGRSDAGASSRAPSDWRQLWPDGPGGDSPPH
jgi:pyruvate dehydrogenase E1 component